MKNRILVACILVLPAALFAFFWWHPVREKKGEDTEIQSTQDVAVAKALASTSPKSAAIIASNFAAPPQTVFYNPTAKRQLAPAGPPSPLEVTNMAPETVLENTRRAVHQFGAMFGGNPVGINSEITSQLMGDNPKHINFIDPDAGMRVNSNGELIDPWGTPYFFHQLSGTDMEIHSAGPDRVMWTADDVVVSQ